MKHDLLSRFARTPAQLALLSVSATILMSAAFLLVTLRLHDKPGLILGLSLFAFGTVVWLKANSELKHGVTYERWPEAQIEPLRRRLESPAYTAVVIGLFITFVASVLFSKHLRAGGWIAYLFIQAIAQLRLAVRRPTAQPAATPMSGWSNVTPLRSDQWGKP